jgi:hypothetical protein
MNKFWLCDYVFNGREYKIHNGEYISKKTYLNYSNNPSKHIRGDMSIE